MKFSNRVPAAIFLLISCTWAQPVIHLKAGPAGGRPSRTLPLRGHATHFLLRFPSEPGPGVRGELERRGMRVLQYVPDAALMVASAAAPDVEGLGVLSASPLEASYKGKDYDLCTWNTVMPGSVHASGTVYELEYLEDGEWVPWDGEAFSINLLPVVDPERYRAETNQR